MTGKFMTAIVAVFLSICSFLGINGVATLVKPTDTPQFQAKDGWNLVFEDNFDGDKMDTTKWHYSNKEDSVRRGGYWVEDAVFVEDGNLVIRTDYRDDGKLGAGWYTGAIETSSQFHDGTQVMADGFEGFSGQYGYYEIRCKIPKIYGAWAAFWMMPDGRFKDDTPDTGEDGAEIDIFESPFMYKAVMKNTVSHAIHVDGYGDKIKSLGSPQAYVKGLYDDYHTFGLEWNEKEYVFYVDGMETWRTNDKIGTVAKVKEFLFLSVEVGGSEIDGVVTPGKEKDENGKIVDYWCGNLDKNDKEKNYDFVVDYVKVFQK